MFSENAPPVPHVVIMAESDQLNPNQNRFSMANPVVNTARVMFDASELQTGPLADMNDDETSDPKNFMEQLTRTLFPEDVDCEAASNPESTRAEVTIDSLSNDVNHTARVRTIAAIAMVPTSPHVDCADDAALLTRLGGTPPKRQRRNRVSFARKFFHATSDIYLQVNTNLALPTFTPDLIGQVITCPTKKKKTLFDKLDSSSWSEDVAGRPQTPRPLLFSKGSFTSTTTWTYQTIP